MAQLLLHDLAAMPEGQGEASTGVVISSAACTATPKRAGRHEGGATVELDLQF